MIIQNENDMMQIANDLGEYVLKNINKNYVIHLRGDLGAGKTTFVKGFMQGMKFPELVNSPTFSLIERIELERHYVFHVDLYRIDNKAELFDLDLHEESSMDKPSIHLIEWPEKGSEVILDPDIQIEFEMMDNPDHREVFFKDFSGQLGNNLDIE